ncbi:hypothetical protein AB0J52_36025, partial [Spirillospora sp. NPDC049652]
MPQQRRLRRIGSAATAVSATALVMTVLGAPAAFAGTTAASAAKPCKKGTDPATTLDNWKCQLDNLRDRVDHHNTPSPSPTKTKAPAKPGKKPAGDGSGDHGGGKGGGGGGKGGGAPGNTGGGPRVSVPSGSGPSVMSDQAPQPFATAAPTGSQSNLPGLLPPQVAGPDTVQPGAAPVPQTRLVAPVAASERTEGDRMLWVAGSAAVVGAGAARNISPHGPPMRPRPRRRGPRAAPPPPP